MGKYYNLLEKRTKLTLDAGGRTFLDLYVGISEYDDKIAEKYPSIFKKVDEEKEIIPYVENIEKEIIPDLEDDKLTELLSIDI